MRKQDVTAIRLTSEQRRKIDRAAAAVGMTRSAFLRAAALTMIRGQKEAKNER
ncbi:MAG: plasmid mobilization protein [Anaerolineales bacterium]